jgi:hypothetical protein
VFTICLSSFSLGIGVCPANITDNATLMITT